MFEEWLLDHETASNVGNWQWLSCTAFYAQFYRCYSPIVFPQKWDKRGDFVRHYVPELAKLGDKYIYEPWKASIKDLRDAGVNLGDGEGEYPKPMLDFNERRSICLDGMKNAYHVGLYGDNPKVDDGTWRTLFKDSAEGPTEGESFDEAYANGGQKIKKGEEAAGDQAVPEDGGEAAETGGDNKGGDKGGSKRKRGQGTLDGHFKKSRK